MFNKKIFQVFIVSLLLFVLMSGVSAANDNIDNDNFDSISSDMILEDSNLDNSMVLENSVYSDNANVSSDNSDNAIYLIDSSKGKLSDNSINVGGELKDSNKNKLSANATEGEYLDVSEAYEYLNAFRTEENVWQLNPDNVSKTYFNSNDTIWLRPLDRDAGLEEAAKIRAKELAQLFSHYRPNGSMFNTTYPDGFIYAGENIAKYYQTAYEVTEGWKETNDTYAGQGHRRAMLDPYFNSVGIAAYKLNGLIYWVQDFGLKNDPKDFDSSNSFYFANNTTIPEFRLDMPIYASGSFNVTIDGNYIGTVSVFQGKASMSVPGLDTGKHTVKLSYSGDYNYKSISETSKITVAKRSALPKTISFSYLNTLVQMAKGNLTLKKNFAYNASTDSMFKDGILISKNLTIYGNGHTLNGKSVARIFNITSKGVNLMNLTFINGYSKSNGGAICSNDELNISDSIFRNNSAKLGGAVYSTVSYYVLSSKFFNNSAERGGALYNPRSVRNSSFADNHASDLGGAIYNSYVYLYYSNFTNNSNIQVYKTIYGSDNVFINDDYYDVFYNASVDGGIVRLDRDWNASQTIMITGDNVVIDGNGHTIDAKNRSRAFYITGENVTIRNLRIINAYSPNDGGAIYSSYSNLNLINSTFENCLSERGGAVYVDSANLTVTDSSFFNNNVEDFSLHSDSEGAAIYVKFGELSIKNSKFINHTALYGGAIYCYSTETSIEDSLFVNNDASLYAGGVIYTDEDVFIRNSTFKDNDALRYGGAIFTYGNANTYINDSTFINNTSKHYGGAINSAKTLEILNSTFIANKAVSSEIEEVQIGSSTATNPAEGGVISAFSNVTIKDSRFINNTAENAGVMYQYNREGYINISSCEFINNTGLDSFGVLDVTTNLFIDNSSFVNNSAKAGTTGAIGSYQNITVRNSSFINNSATGTNTSRSTGGAIRNFGDNVLIEDSIFANNSADEGGAIFTPFDTNLTVVNSTFSSNSANNGGAINQDNYRYWEGGHDKGNASIIDCRFTDNTAKNGGAIYNRNSTFNIQGSNFTNNKASNGSAIRDYGGIVNLADSTLRYDDELDAIVGNVIIRNSTILEKNHDVTLDYINHNRTANNTVNGTNGSAGGNSSVPVNGTNGSAGGNSSAGNSTSPKSTSLKISANNIRVGSNEVINFTLTSSDNLKLSGKIDVKVGTKSYNVTVSNGKGSLTLKGLSIGSYTVTANYNGNSTYNKSSASAKFSVSDVIGTRIIYSDMNTSPVNINTQGRIGNYFVVKLVDGNGKALAGLPIKIGFNGKIYDKFTTSNGMAKLQINLKKEGTYTFAICFLGDDDYNGSFEVAKITVNKKNPKPNKANESATGSSLSINKTLHKIKTNIIYEDMNTVSVHAADGRIGKYFVVKLVDSNGKALSKLPIKIGFNGKIYDKNTTSDGSARLQINLAKAGVYTFAIGFLPDSKYQGSFAVAKINVTKQSPKLTASPKKFKLNAKTKSVSATLKTVNGNPIKNKKLVFTINGKKYSGKTNSKGVASVKISLSKRGSYTCTAKYEGDNVLKATSKKFNVKIV